MNWLSNQPDIKMRPLVSVIIPCYNNEAFLGESIASVLNQTYSNVEVIVIDDGSTDFSQKILRAFGCKVRWETQPNQGAPTARNRGLEIAKGDYVKFLDADDVLLPTCLEKQIKQSESIPKNYKAIVYGEAVWVDQHRQPIPGYSLRPRLPDEDNLTHILNSCPLTSCPLHQRKYLLEANGFNPSLPRGQEFDLHLRLVLAGVEFLYYPEAVYEYRNDTDSDRISNQTFSTKGALVLHDILQKQQALIEASLGQPLPSASRQAIAKRYWQFGRGVLREGHQTAAQQYFQTAQELDRQHCIVGQSPYPELVKWLGPYRAEAILTQLKQLKLNFAG